jgi:hypothetical protein
MIEYRNIRKRICFICRTDSKLIQIRLLLAFDSIARMGFLLSNYIKMDVSFKKLEPGLTIFALIFFTIIFKSSASPAAASPHACKGSRRLKYLLLLLCRKNSVPGLTTYINQHKCQQYPASAQPALPTWKPQETKRILASVLISSNPANKNKRKSGLETKV